VPQPAAYSPTERTLLATADGLINVARTAMREQQLHQMLNAVFAVVADANRDFATAAPWELAKRDPARMATVLYVTAEVIRQVAILVQPVMPAAGAKLLDLLAVDPAARTFAFLGERGRLRPGAALPKPAPVFPRYIEPEAGEGDRKTVKGAR
jgi:methionyl-tRNA synthetase